MKFRSLDISGVYEAELNLFEDERGSFVKTYHGELFLQTGFEGCFVESYYSQSYKNVIRGMHFQLPPYDHEKLVYVTEGSILDVIVDLRKTSVTYGKHISLELKAFGNAVFIPKGCAHGFLTLTETATVVYSVATVYNASADTGIHYNSFGFNWGVDRPIVSQRDNSFVSLHQFNSPF